MTEKLFQPNRFTIHLLVHYKECMLKSLQLKAFYKIELESYEGLTKKIETCSKQVSIFFYY